MPICKGCGGSFDDNFKFCPYCGRAKPEPDSLKIQLSVSPKIRWETCKICYRDWETYSLFQVINGRWGEFWASAIGPKGIYVAGESPVFSMKKGPNIAHSFLVDQLSYGGWKAIAIPSGNKWWEISFRRQVKEDNPKPWRTWELNVYEIPSPYKHVTLVHPLNDIKPPSDSKYIEMSVYGKSAEFKPIFLEGFAFRETEERRKVVKEFLQQMVGEGFELVEPSLTEKLKKVIKSNVSELWYYHVLLKRE